MGSNLPELRRRHKELDHEIADAVKHYSADDLIIGDETTKVALKGRNRSARADGQQRRSVASSVS